MGCQHSKNVASSVTEDSGGEDDGKFRTHVKNHMKELRERSRDQEVACSSSDESEANTVFTRSSPVNCNGDGIGNISDEGGVNVRAREFEHVCAARLCQPAARNPPPVASCCTTSTPRRKNRNYSRFFATKTIRSKGENDDNDKNRSRKRCGKKCPQVSSNKCPFPRLPSDTDSSEDSLPTPGVVEMCYDADNKMKLNDNQIPVKISINVRDLMKNQSQSDPPASFEEDKMPSLEVPPVKISEEIAPLEPIVELKEERAGSIEDRSFILTADVAELPFENGREKHEEEEKANAPAETNGDDKGDKKEMGETEMSRGDKNDEQKKD